MKILARAVVIGLIAGFAGPALAADLAGGKVYYSSAGFCRLVHPSPILDFMPDIRRVEDEVAQRLDHSANVAENPDVIFNRSPAYVWASETKVSCGKALGYMAWRDINFEAVDKCDCFYNRMLSFLHR